MTKTIDKAKLLEYLTGIWHETNQSAFNAEQKALQVDMCMYHGMLDLCLHMINKVNSGDFDIYNEYTEGLQTKLDLAELDGPL